MEYCCQAWAGVLNCYFDVLNALSKQLYGDCAPAIAVSHESLAQRWSMVSYSLFY